MEDHYVGVKERLDENMTKDESTEKHLTESSQCSGTDKAVTSRFKTVCVFCGSSVGKRECYRDTALDLGKQLLARKVDLVYGGGSIGLMGLVSKEVHRGGGNVLGIIPTPLTQVTGETVGKVRLQLTCITGRTMEELLEAITWFQLGIRDKPVSKPNQPPFYQIPMFG